MTVHPNAVLVRQLFEAFKQGDIAKIEELLHTDAVWHFPGRRGGLAGAHRGRTEIFGFLANVTQLTSGTFHLELETIVADEDLAVAFFIGHGERKGRTLENPTSLKIRIEDGKVVELHEFVWDLDHVEAFWS